MRRAFVIASIGFLVFTSSLFGAQARPNFSGKWSLVPEPGAGSPSRGAGELGTQFTAVQDEKTLTFVTRSSQLGEIKSTYNLDGSESRNPLTFAGTTVERVSRTKWDGSTLAIATTISSGSNTAESVQVLSFDASGNLIVATRSNINGNTPPTTVAYRKASGG